MKLEVSRMILFVKEMELMLRFYEEVLGLQRLEAQNDSAGFISLDGGAMQISLHQIPKRIAKTIEISDPPIERKNMPMKLVFRVENVAEVRKSLAAKGVSMLKTQHAGAICFCDGVDPEGNIFQISNRP